MLKRFTNLDPGQQPPDFAAFFRWSILDRVLFRRRVQPPGEPAPRVEPDIQRIHNPGNEVQLTWIGHASFLLSIGGRHVLIDPVFSPRIGIFYKRHVPPGLVPDQLPSIDAVLISHNHYDHLDASSINSLPCEVKVVAPLGLGDCFRRRSKSNVVELDWWQSTEVGRSSVTLVPARHWSRRRLFDQNSSLWGGFVVEANGAAVYFAGDTATDRNFDPL